jgi:hypothetical protein
VHILDFLVKDGIEIVHELKGLVEFHLDFIVLDCLGKLVQDEK